jgi:hypothetical protein
MMQMETKHVGIIIGVAALIAAIVGFWWYQKGGMGQNGPIKEVRADIGNLMVMNSDAKNIVKGKESLFDPELMANDKMLAQKEKIADGIVQKLIPLDDAEFKAALNPLFMSVDGLIVVDDNGAIVGINPKAEQDNNLLAAFLTIRLLSVAFQKAEPDAGARFDHEMMLALFGPNFKGFEGGRAP